MVKMIALSKWVGIFLGLLFSASLAFQAWQLYRFVNAGPRFTAVDGDELCQRVRTLEQVSYGYLESGKKPLTCNYMHRK